jgi:hypothetical protein
LRNSLGWTGGSTSLIEASTPYTAACRKPHRAPHRRPSRPRWFLACSLDSAAVVVVSHVNALAEAHVQAKPRRLSRKNATATSDYFFRKIQQMLAFIDKQREIVHTCRPNVNTSGNEQKRERKEKRDYGDEPATLMALFRHPATQNHGPAS